jgi:hypothetical protein
MKTIIEIAKEIVTVIKEEWENINKSAEELHYKLQSEN